MIKIKTNPPSGLAGSCRVWGTEVYVGETQIKGVLDASLAPDAKEGADRPWVLTLRITVDPATLFETKGS